MMTLSRDLKALTYINKSGKGVEIGPSHRPIAPKCQGYDVHIIDHMGKEELVNKYQHHGVDLKSIEAVDFVWQGESYLDLTNNPKFYDWVIASHVIEHSPDLIGFICSCDEILKDDGVLSLVIPDKRYCFDHFRPITGLAKVIDSHHQGNKIHTAGTVAEYFLNVVALNKAIAWQSKTTGEYSFVHSLQDALKGIETVQNTAAYIDVHSWCFTPTSFRLLIHDLFSLGLISLQEVGFFPTEGCEFFISLGRNGKGVQTSRLDLLKQIEIELTEPIGFKKQGFSGLQQISEAGPSFNLRNRAFKFYSKVVQKIKKTF